MYIWILSMLPEVMSWFGGLFLVWIVYAKFPRMRLWDYAPARAYNLIWDRPIVKWLICGILWPIGFVWAMLYLLFDYIWVDPDKALNDDDNKGGGTYR